MIIVVDFGMGNLRSVLHKLGKLNIPAIVSSDPEEIKKASKIILPGVGAFGAGINNLKTLGLVDVLNHKVLIEKTPILGICVGLQLMAQRSEEGNAKGLGWVDADVCRFQFEKEANLRVPHVGWNTLIQKKDCCLLNNIETNQRFYYTHSYYLKSNHPADIVATTRYGDEFVAIIQRENIFGVQFHPEKSHRRGIEIYKNFVEMC